MRTLKLDDLPAIFSEVLDEDFCRTLVKSCIFRLTEMNHTPGVKLEPFPFDSYLIKHPIVIEWKIALSQQARNTFQDKNRTTDFAAMCIALGFVPLLTKYKFVIVAQLETGIDFWLTNDKTGQRLEARLEVSGIRKSTKANTISKRLKIKESQMEKSAGSKIPAYISIIEFSQPEAIFIDHENR
jgi:hypothetical protein